VKQQSILFTRDRVVRAHPPAPSHVSNSNLPPLHRHFAHHQRRVPLSQAFFRLCIARGLICIFPRLITCAHHSSLFLMRWSSHRYTPSKYEERGGEVKDLHSSQGGMASCIHRPTTSLPGGGVGGEL
jgi:hypothetical protein